MLRPACLTALVLLPLPALAQEFPLTIDTAFGPVTIETAPERWRRSTTPGRIMSWLWVFSR